MNLGVMDGWLATAKPLTLTIGLLAAMALAAVVGFILRTRLLAGQEDDQAEGQEGYIVSAVLGLLALLMGFTFSLAVDRFESRRQLVLEESNAIGTAYLRAQLLNDPHRNRISAILVRYADNRLALANAGPGHTDALLAIDSQLDTDLWAATNAAFDDVKGLDYSSTFVEAINSVIDLGAARKAARNAHVPTEVFGVLLIYIVVTSGVLGYVLTGPRGRTAAGVMLVLLAVSLLLIIDIDRPTMGGIRESQGPMEDLVQSLKDQPPPVFDRYRTSGPRTAAFMTK